MIFDGDKLLIVGLADFELPTRTMRLCDGGFLDWNGQRYDSIDPDFGTIASVEAISLGTGDEAPAFRLVFAPSSTAAAATLSSPSFQGSPIRFWKAEVNEMTGQVIAVKLLASALLDTTTLRVGRGTRSLEMDCVTENERLFSRNRANGLSPGFHKRVNPGELGLDNATGAIINEAWGVEGPARGMTSVGSGVGGGGPLGNVYRAYAA